MSTSGGGCGSLDKATKAYMFEYQEPATLTQAAPVQNTWYTVLDTAANCRVYHIGLQIADTNETLACRITIDGQVSGSTTLAAVAGTPAYVKWYIHAGTLTANAQASNNPSNDMQSFVCEGHSVKVEVRKITVAGAGTLTAIVAYGVLTAI